MLEKLRVALTVRTLSKTGQKCKKNLTPYQFEWQSTGLISFATGVMLEYGCDGIELRGSNHGGTKETVLFAVRLGI